MTLLNEADSIRLGAAAAERAYLGDNKVWPAENLQWTLAGSWIWTSVVSAVTFTNLHNYNEIRVLLRKNALVFSGQRIVRVSTNNGASYLSTTGDYTNVDGDGAATPASYLTLAGSSTNSCSGELIISGWNLTTLKFAQNNSLNYIRTFFIPTTSPLNAIQITETAGEGFWSGSIFVWGR